MKSVELSQNSDGTWTARIKSTCFCGTYQQCVDWLKGHNEWAIMNPWIAVTHDLPPIGLLVKTRVDDAVDGPDKKKRLLKRHGRHGLWFYPDESMPTDYTPTHWRRIEPTDAELLDGSESAELIDRLASDEQDKFKKDLWFLVTAARVARRCLDLGAVRSDLSEALTPFADLQPY
jgi:hypothetical protein